MIAVLKWGWIIAQVVVGFNLIFPVLLGVIFIIARTFRRRRNAVVNQQEEADYAIIVTAYEQTDLVPDAVQSLLAMDYSNYMIYVVADKCDVSQLKFDSDKVVVLRPEETIANNVGSHFYAINRFVRPHERLTIIDSDNLTDPGYLKALDRFFNEGFDAVQGVREAKNLDSVLACLDAARDKYYHFYDGDLLFNAGSSATLAGSGMAFTTTLYRSCLEDISIDGAGFDKVLQYRIVRSGKRIAFAGDAIVYDQKTSKADQLVKQRSRWINTWFRYFRFGFGLSAKGISGSWNQFLFGLVLLRPPLFLFLLMSVVFLAADLFMAPAMAICWLAAFGLFVAGFMASLVLSETDGRIYRALKAIPVFIFYQFLSLLKARRANQYSIATKHETL